MKNVTSFDCRYSAHILDDWPGNALEMPGHIIEFDCGLSNAGVDCDFQFPKRRNALQLDGAEGRTGL